MLFDHGIRRDQILYDLSMNETQKSRWYQIKFNNTYGNITIYVSTLCDTLNEMMYAIDLRLQMNDVYIAVQCQKAVPSYFSSKQILPFGFAEQYITVVFVENLCPTTAIE